ncbi:MAG: hypothetical protein KJZ65_15680 [Phycisphaerales bacterium]|nr:hypothetical protein [Phycisphaerales bacterium]
MSTVMHDDALCARAFQIADECMIAQLECHAVRIHLDNAAGATPARPRFGLCDDSGFEVESLEQADAAIKEAFSWLKQRGLVALGKDAQGEFIELMN